MNELIKSDRFERLIKDIQELREVLSDLYFEDDNLQFIECRNIEIAYLLEFGNLLYKVQSNDIESRRLKRKLDLVQKYVNRQEKINLAMIEDILDEEYERYKKSLEKQLKKLSEAIEYSLLERLSDDEVKYMKYLYRKIVKKLHPDLNPNVTASQLNLYETAVSAYRDGDLKRLEIIFQTTDLFNNINYSKSSLEELEDERFSLNMMIADEKDKISHIKSTYPYNLKDLMLDEDKIDAYHEKLNDLLAYYQGLCNYYKKKIEELLRSENDE